jgi:hypothetical protein
VQVAMTRSSGSTVSRISATVWLGGNKSNQGFEQDLASAIHEGPLVIAKRLDTVKQGAVQGGAGGEFGIGVEIVFDIVAEKNLIPEHILRAVKNGLAGNKALSWQCKRERR